jgi:hypothetical protein
MFFFYFFLEEDSHQDNFHDPGDSETNFFHSLELQSRKGTVAYVEEISFSLIKVNFSSLLKLFRSLGNGVSVERT